MTVEELIDQLAKMPADAPVMLEIGEVYSEPEITITLGDDGWVVVSG